MSRSILSPLIKAKVEKLTIVNGGKPLIYSSSPVIIPKQSMHTNASPPPSSSLYISVADQMSSVKELLTQSHEEGDDGYTSLPVLASTCQLLEHSAARDRIAVKNKRRQAIKEKLINVDETGSDQNDSNDDEVISKIEVKNDLQQPIVDLKDLDVARLRLRSHENSAAKHVVTFIVPTDTSSIQRSISLKRSQDVNSNEEIQEHIYDNFDFYKHQIKTNLNQSTNTSKSKEHFGRLRPVTMYLPTTTDKINSNEFENVFNQFKNKSLKKRSPSKERKEVEIPSMIIEETLQSSMSIEQTSGDFVVKQETSSSSPSTPINKTTETPNRRRTVGGINLIEQKKVTMEDQQTKPSWIEIAKQKQSKFQSEPIEEKSEPVIIVRKELTIPSNTVLIKENAPEDTRSNRKTLYEPMLPRLSPSSTAHIIERDSIRALKAANPNRINNLIQLFDKA